MLGLMQDWPLLIHRIIDHAAIQHGASAGRHRARSRGRCTAPPTRSCAGARCGSRSASSRDGVQLGDRVATLAWNTWRHLEAWYGITGIGAIYHTVNPRLFEDQIVYIVNHAEDRLLFLDLTFVPLIEKLQQRAADDRALHRPHRRRAHAGDDAQERRRLRGLDRRGGRRFRLGVASTRTPPPACATPPARPASRRACSIRTARTCCTRSPATSPDFLGLSSRDVVMPVVPLFHANGWSLRVLGADGRRRPRAAGPEARRRRRCTSCSREPRVTITRRGADRVARAPAAPRSDRRDALEPEARGDRRLRLPARHDRGVRDEVRRHVDACLGHDGDEPARLVLLDQAGLRRPRAARRCSTSR